MNYKRQQVQILKSRINEPRKRIQVILGPRQVGKTTCISQLLEEIKIPFHFVSADNQINSNINWVEQQWDIARIKLKSNQTKDLLLVIDEIQKINNWSEIIKSQWDSDTRNKINIKLILLGSSTLLIQKGLSESLAGRFEIIKMYHWSYSEMKAAFNITEEQFAWFGGYPGAIDLINHESRWKNYIKNSIIDTTIFKDLLFQTRIDKPVLLKNLFELGCLYSGQILSFNKILGQLQDSGNTTTLSNYLRLFSKAGLLEGIEKYSPDIVRQRSSSPKFQVFNSALLSSISSLNFNEVLRKPEIWGRIIETAVGVHLLNNSITESYSIYYWRHLNNEIDFVVKYKGKLFGIEVKSGKTKNIKGVEVFQKSFHPHKIFIIGYSGIEWKEFLRINPTELFD